MQNLKISIFGSGRRQQGSMGTNQPKLSQALLLVFKLDVVLWNIKIITQQSMNNSNPNQFKYKAAIFYAFILGVVCAVLGVEFFQNIYFIFALLAIGYCLIKYVQMVFVMGYVNFKYSQAMKSYKLRLTQNYSSLKQITHVFILPNFNEDIDILRQTIQNLATHSRSKSYCLFLAMEKHQANAEVKAKRMLKQFDSKFRVLSYTIHEIVEGESKTKSSNINYCVRNMSPKLLENYVNMDTVIITIMDSDSIIPEAYVDQVEKHIQQNYDNKHTYIYQPPQMFTRNEREVAFFVRSVDNMMAWMHCSNLYSMFQFTLGVSNYSMSYRLLERIGFWDTCNFSKGEDIRTPAKAVWKTNGQAKTHPIYIPINQMSLATGKGYWADLKARLLQAKRHAQDQTEVSYNFVNMTQSKMSLIKRLHTFYSICQIYMMLIIIPIPVVVLIFQDIIPLLPRSSFDSGSVFILLNNVNTLILLSGFTLFQIFKARASNQLYGIKTLNFFTAIQTPLLQIPLYLLFGFMPMVLASINLLTDKVTFTVTPKSKSSSSKESLSMFQSEEIQQNELIEDSKKIALSNQVGLK